MKKLEDLNIQPTPWSVDDDGCVLDANGEHVNDYMYMPECGCAYSTAILVKTAPKLYAALHEAIVEVCHDCPSCGSCPPEYACYEEKGKCFVQKWRKVLAEAAGEGETK